MTSTPTRPVDNVVIATKGLQDRNINILAGTTVENKGKLILIRMELEKIGINAGNWVDSSQDRNYWSALVNAAVNLWVP